MGEPSVASGAAISVGPQSIEIQVPSQVMDAQVVLENPETEIEATQPVRSRHYSPDEFRVAYAATASNVSMSSAASPPTTTVSAPSTTKGVGTRRRSSDVPDGQQRYQKKLTASRPSVVTAKRATRQEELYAKRGSKCADANVGGAPRSRRSSSIDLRSEDGPGSRRPSKLSIGNGDPLALAAAAAASSATQSRRSSRASAIFLTSPTKDGQLTMLRPEPEEGSPEELRRRRTISIIATVGAFLLVLSILLVTITLRLATHIDDLGTFNGHASTPPMVVFQCRYLV